MKILYLVSGIGPPAGWGTEFIQNLIVELSQKNVDAVIINPIYKHTHPSWKSWAKDLSTQYNIRFVHIQSPDWIQNNLILHLILTPIFVTYTAARLLKKEKFDLIHEFSSIPIILLRALIFKLAFNTPTILTLSVYNNSLIGSLKWFKLLDFGKYYLIPSREIILKLKHIGVKAHKIYFIPPSIDLKRFKKPINKQLARKQLNLPKSKYIISYFGPLTEEKGVGDIINAAKQFEKNLTENYCVYLYTIWKGSNEQANLIKRINDAKSPFLQLRKEFIDIPTLLSASDCILLPQRSGFGTTIPPISTIETLASRKPIITTDIIGNREWVTKNNGILIKPYSPESIVDAIKKIVNFKNLKQDYKLDVFDLDHVVENYLKIYKLSNNDTIPK